MKLGNFYVDKVETDVAREFIMEHHYSGSCHAGPMAWGCFNGNDKLVGVIAFATPISENVRRFVWEDEYEEEMKHHTTELHRLVTLDETPHNTETWFISRGLDALKEYKPKYKAVLSHADQTEGHDGTIYKASNAIYTGTTGGKNTFYRDENGNLRAPRQNGVNITVDEARERGWEPEKREAKHRYLFLTPDEYETKDDIREKLSVESKPYP
jgi:hypothetical protein